MRRRIVVCSAVTAVTVLGLTGCAHGTPPPVVPAGPVPAASTPAPAALPGPDTLTAVLSRLADPELPGAEKLTLVEGSEPADAGSLDRFVTALKDNGYLPLSFDATDIAWSDREPGSATANVEVTTANPDHRGFFFPMEFVRRGDGWQLSRKTADMLLALSSSRASTPSAAPSR